MPIYERKPLIPIAKFNFLGEEIRFSIGSRRGKEFKADLSSPEPLPTIEVTRSHDPYYEVVGTYVQAVAPSPDTAVDTVEIGNFLCAVKEPLRLAIGPQINRDPIARRAVIWQKAKP